MDYLRAIIMASIIFDFGEAGVYRSDFSLL